MRKTPIRQEGQKEDRGRLCSHSLAWPVALNFGYSYGTAAIGTSQNTEYVVALQGRHWISSM